MNPHEISIVASANTFSRSRFHFSFAQYHDPDNINFGVLCVLNDDLGARNAREIVGEDVTIGALATSHVLVIEMSRPG